MPYSVYGENSLWLTNTTNVYTFNVISKQFTQANVLQANIKSVSSGGSGFPVFLVRPKESWWTDEVLDAKGNSIFSRKGWKIYKARWVIPNTFSYPANDQLHLCTRKGAKQLSSKGLCFTPKWAQQKSGKFPLPLSCFAPLRDIPRSSSYFCPQMRAVKIR